MIELMRVWNIGWLPDLTQLQPDICHHPNPELVALHWMKVDNLLQITHLNFWYQTSTRIFWGKRVEYYYDIGGCPIITCVVVLSLPQRHRYGVVKDKSPYQTQDQLNPTVYYICTVLNIMENVGITNVVECNIKCIKMPWLCCEAICSRSLHDT